MKTLYYSFLGLLLIPFSAGAQLVLTKAANEPVSGDVRNAASFDSVAAVPKSTGLNKSWNLSSFANSTWTETTTYTTLASAPNYTQFTGATLAAMRGTNNYEFYKSSNNNWEYVGDMNPANNSTMNLSSNSAVFYVWPVSFGNTNSDLASGTMTDNATVFTMTGQVSYTASGTGTVTLPGGAVYNNCLQVMQSVSVAMTSGTVVNVMTQISYQYFAAGKKFPIAEIQYSKQSGPSGVTNDFFATFDVGAITAGLTENSYTSGVRAYPVPSTGRLDLELPGNKQADQVEVYDLNAQLIMSLEKQNSMDLSGLSTGVYMLVVKSGASNFTKRIVIQK
ncbi:MAG TPA: T9SS type A sorting domain-containing protein [Bacteroidia bacterium]|nr:T9SS type A sorting domain-containing protein [Bacteroidia bacterium]